MSEIRSVYPVLNVHTRKVSTVFIDQYRFPAAGGGGTAYRYYRVLRADGGGGAYGLCVMELELFTATTAPGGAIGSNSGDLTAGLGVSGSFSSGSADSSGAAKYAFDDNGATDYYSGATTPAYLGIDIGTATAARSANVKCSYNGSGATTLKLQACNDWDGTTGTWVDLASTAAWATGVTYALAW